MRSLAIQYSRRLPEAEGAIIHSWGSSSSLIISSSRLALRSKSDCTKNSFCTQLRTSLKVGCLRNGSIRQGIDAIRRSKQRRPLRQPIPSHPGMEGTVTVVSDRRDSTQ